MLPSYSVKVFSEAKINLANEKMTWTRNFFGWLHANAIIASAQSTQIREFLNNFAIANSIHNHTVNMQKSSALKHAPLHKEWSSSV